jgi:hypothetical protein
VRVVDLAQVVEAARLRIHQDSHTQHILVHANACADVQAPAAAQMQTCLGKGRVSVRPLWVMVM